jgi:hypothetical protein
MQSQQLALQQKSQNQPLPAQSVAMQIVPVQAEMTRSVDPRVAAMKNKLDKEQQKRKADVCIATVCCPINCLTKPGQTCGCVLCCPCICIDCLCSDGIQTYEWVPKP